MKEKNKMQLLALVVAAGLVGIIPTFFLYLGITLFRGGDVVSGSALSFLAVAGGLTIVKFIEDELTKLNRR